MSFSLIRWILGRLLITQNILGFINTCIQCNKINKAWQLSCTVRQAALWHTYKWAVYGLDWLLFSPQSQRSKTEQRDSYMQCRSWSWARQVWVQLWGKCLKNSLSSLFKKIKDTVWQGPCVMSLTGWHREGKNKCVYATQYVFASKEDVLGEGDKQLQQYPK